MQTELTLVLTIKPLADILKHIGTPTSTFDFAAVRDNAMAGFMSGFMGSFMRT